MEFEPGVEMLPPLPNTEELEVVRHLAFVVDRAARILGLELGLAFDERMDAILRAAVKRPLLIPADYRAVYEIRRVWASLPVPAEVPHGG